MKKLNLILAIVIAAALSACASTAPTAQPVDAEPVLQGGQPLKTAMGHAVTGRDWNAAPSESRDTESNDSGNGER